jgi:hypothetical protein
MATSDAVRKAKTLAIVTQHAEQRRSLTELLVRALLGLWGGFDRFDQPDLVGGHVARSLVLVDTSLDKTRRLARSMATSMLAAIDEFPRDLPSVKDLYPRSGVNALDVYRRPANLYRWQRSLGKTDAEARKVMTQRLTDLAQMDVMRAEDYVTQDTYSRSPGVIGRRRIIHPELSKSGFSCGLCVVAADRIYKVSELKPVHGHCNCTDSPITKGFDPGEQMNRDDLDAIYKAAGGSTFAEDLVDVRVSYNQHGELGPYITLRGDHYRDHKEAERLSDGGKLTGFSPRTIEEQRASWQDAIDRAQRAVARLERDKLADADRSVDYTTAIKHYRDLISRYSRKLG